MADATEALRRRLEVIPSDRQAFDALVDTLKKSGDPAALVRSYERRLQVLPDSEEVPGLLVELARAREHGADGPAKARRSLELGLARRPDDELILDELIRLYEAEENWALVTRTLQRKERLARDETEAAAIRVRLGDIQSERMGREAEGLEWYSSALEWDPKNVDASSKAWRLAVTLGRLKTAEAILEKSVDAVATAEAWLELGRRMTAEPWYGNAARRCLERARDKGAAEEAKKLLAEIEGRTRNWKQLVRELRADAVETRDKRKAAEGYLRIAQINALFDGDATKVLEDLDKVFMLNPSDLLALEFVESWYAQREDHAGLVEALTRFAGALKDRQASARIWLRLARVQVDRLGDLPAAGESCKKALELDPGDAGAADLLISFLEGKGAWEEAAQVMEKRLTATSDRSVQRNLRLSLARLYQRHLDDSAKAVAHLETAFSLDRLDMEIAAELEPLLREAGVHEKLAEVLEARLNGQLDPDSRRRVLDRLAELYLEHLNQPEQALAALSRAAVLDPKREKVWDRIAELAAAAGRLDLHTRALGIAAGSVEGELRVSLLVRLGSVFETTLSDPGGAAELYREVLGLVPEQPDALAGLERTLASSGSTEELTQALETKISGSSGAEQRDSRLKLARHHLEQTGRLEEARDIFLVLLEGDGSSVDLLTQLAEVQERMKDHAGLAETLSRRLSRFEGEKHELLALQLRLARLKAEHLDAPEEAAELYGRVFEADPARSGVAAALESLLAQGVAGERIASLLAPHYAASGDWPRHLSMLEARLLGMKTPEERASVLVAMARVQEEQLVDRRQALATSRRAFEEIPTDDTILERVERLAAEVGAPTELEAMLAEVVGRPSGGDLSPERVQALRGRLAQVREIELGDMAGAARAHREILESTQVGEELHVTSLNALARIAETGEQWDHLAEALKRLAELETKATIKAELLTRQGLLLMERMGLPADAAVVLESALQAGADESVVLEPLTDALQAAGRQEALAEVLARRVALAEKAGDDSLVARLKLRRASLLSEGLGQRGEAVETWSAILVDRPTDPDARASLEALLNDPELGLTAARALAPAYERSHDHKRLVSVLELEVEAAPSETVRAEVLQRISGIQARELRDQSGALASLSRAILETPANQALRAELHGLAADAGVLEVVPKVLEQAAARVSDRELAVDLLLEAAEWTDERMGNRQEAITRHRAVLEHKPGHPPSIAALHRLLRAAGAWQDLAQVCLLLAEQAPDEGARRSMWREAGRVHEEHTGDLSAAAAAYRLILEAEPSDLESARSLDRLYEALGRAEDLAWTLEVGREQAGRGERHRELTYRLAELRRTRLGDLDSALDLFRGLLEEDPGHRPTRQALDRLVAEGGVPADRALRLLDPCLVKSGEHRARATLRESRLSRADTEGMPEARRAELHAEMRRIQEKDMDAPELAFMTACRQLTEGVAFEVARDEAERLAKVSGASDALCEVFEEVAGELADGDERKADLFRRIARHRTEAGLADDAIAAWKKVQALAPTDRDVLEALEQLYQKRHDAVDLVEIYRQKVDLSPNAKERTAARLELARLLEQTGSTDGAVEAYELAAAEAGGETDLARAALEHLERLHGRAGRWKDLARVLAALVKILEGKPERLRHLLRLGELFEEKDAHPSRALEIHAAILAEGGVQSQEGAGAVLGLERLMANDETKARAAALLEPIYRENEQYRQLAEALEARLTATRVLSDRIGLLEEIAGLYETRIGQKPMAFMVWCRAFREDPRQQGVLDRLEILAKETEGWEELACVYEDEIERLGEGSETLAARLRVHMRLSELFETRLAQRDKAVAQQRRVFELAPDDVEAGRRLVKQLQRVDAHQEVIAVYRRLVEIVKSPADKKELWSNIAVETESVLDDRAGAVLAWREALALCGDEPDSEILAKLARIHQELQDWPALAEVYQQEIAVATAQADTMRASEWLHALGMVRFDRLADPIMAVEAFTLCLEQNPYHVEAVASLEAVLAAGAAAEGAAREAAANAAALLEPRYAESADNSRRVGALEVLAAFAEDPVQRCRHFVSIADVHLGEGGSDEMAFMALSRALRAEPESLELLQRLAEVAARAELEEEEAGILEELLPSIRTEAVRGAYLRRYGSLQAEAGEVSDAIEAFRSLLDLLPGDEEALDRLARLTRIEGDHGALIDVLRQQLAVAVDDARQLALLRQIAALQEERLSDTSAALNTWRQVLEIAPNDREALVRMDSICLREERWTELEDVLGREAKVAADSADTAGQVGFLSRMAELRSEQLQDVDGAMDLYRRVLELVPGHPVTVERLEEILKKDKRRVDSARVLEDVYRQQERWADLLAALENRAAVEIDNGVKREILWEMHEIHDRNLDSPDMAFIVLCRSFNEDPSEQRVRRSLERLADITEQHEELAAVYEDALDEVSMPSVATDMRATLARLYEERLHDPDRAIALWEQVADETDEDPLVPVQALDRLYRRKERWPELAQILEREASLVQDERDKVTVLFRLGQLCADVLKAPNRAAGFFEELLELEPTHLPALRGIESLYEEAGNWEKLEKNLERQLSASTDPQARERLTGRLADVLGDRLNELDRAIELWQGVLETNRRSEPALRALEKLYEKAEKWTDLAALLRKCLEQTVDPREVTRLSARLGWVLGTRLGEAEDAIRSFKSVLERDPRNEQALSALWEIYDAQGEFEELVVVLKRLAPLQTTPDGLRKVRFRLTEVLGRELGKKDEAMEASRRFLDIQPHEATSLHALEELLREIGAKNELVKVMEFRARALARDMEEAEASLSSALESEAQGTGAIRMEAVGSGGSLSESEVGAATGDSSRDQELELSVHLDDEEAQVSRPAWDEVSQTEISERIASLRMERIELLFEIARAHEEELEKPIGGASALDEVLTIEPANRRAYEGLRGLFDTAKRWRDLAALLDRFLPYADDSVEQKSILCDVSRLQEVNLGQKELAFMAIGRAVAIDPYDVELEAEIVRLAGETDAWDEVCAILEDVAEGVEIGPRKSQILLRLAEVQHRRLDDPEEAESSIRRVLSFDPGNPVALDALAGLFSDRGQDRELIVALEQKIESSGEVDEQKSILGRIAAIHQNQLSDIEETIATWQRVLDLDGGDKTAIDALVRLFETGERWEDLVRILERAVDSNDDMDEKAGIQLRLAQLFEEKLADDNRAIAALRGALDFSPLHAASVAALEQLFTRLELWSDLLQTYENQVESIEDETEKIAVLLKIAALEEETFDRRHGAIEALERVLVIDPIHGMALRDLARLLRHLEKWDRLIEVLNTQIEQTRDVVEAVRLHLELGEIWETQLQDHEKAEWVYQHALEIDPESRTALRALGDLLERNGKWTEAIAMMDREAKVIGVGEEAVRLHERMGSIHEEMLQDFEKAEECHSRAVELDPTHLPSLRALKNLAERGENWKAYLDYLIQEARYTDDLAEKTRLFYQAGVFVRDRQDDPDRALEFFEEALEKTEDDLESAEAAAALHYEQENWDRTEQLLTVVCEKRDAAGDEPESLCRHWYKLAYVRRKLGRQEKTLEAFSKAYDHDATYLPALEGLGASLVAAQRWEEALKIFQTILIHHRDSVTDLEVVEYYWQLGEINARMEQNERAIKAYEKALEIDPGHEPSLSGIIRRLEAQEKWDEAVEFRHQLLEMLDGEDKYEMHLAIGRLAHEKLEDPYQAIDAYLGAARLRPGALAPLDSLRVLYRETRQSAKRAETLQRLLDHPEVEEDRSKLRLYHFALGELLRDELKDIDGAIKHFDATLDADFTYGKAFEAIEALFSRQKRWGDLEQAYVRMIQRIPKGAKTHAVRMGMWRTLGELYRQVLRSLDGAIYAYQVVCKGDPEDPQAIETLAELLAQKPGAEKEAVAAFHQALKVTTEPVRVARAMLRLYSAQKSYDKAYSVAAVINDLIGDAQPDEETLYQRLKPFAKDSPRRSMSDRLWEQYVYHEKIKGPVAEILGIVYDQAGAELAVDPKDLGLNPKKDRVDLNSSMLYFANIYKQVGQVLGMDGVPLYQRSDQNEGLAVVNSFPVSLVASDEMMGRSRKKELWFTISKAMAFTRPELALGRLHGLEEIELILHAAVSLVRPGIPPSQDARVQRLQRKFQRALSPGAMQGLAQAVAKWRTDNLIADLRAYAEGVEHTANRMGILMCGDVSVAKGCLMEDKGGAAKLPLRSKVRELVMFCLSEEYFALREALGMAVEIQTQARSS